jgi:alpha-methylacyl-CoA racemase
MTGPLRGLKVLELAGIGPTPYACMLLADLGADVLRLERGNFDASPETSWDILNRSRPSVALDLKNTAGRGLVLELAEQAQVLVEGFRPGVTERLGLGPDEVWLRNPKLIYARMSGYGQQGPLSQRAGHDLNYIAVSGALWPIGRAGDRPVPPLNLVGDFAGAAFLAFGILAAVRHAEATGEGQVVDVAMVDTSASMMAMTYSFINEGLWHEYRGTNLLDSGAHFYDTYETSDGKYVAVAAIEAKFYEQLLLGLDVADENLPPQMKRSTWPSMKERFTSIFATKTREEWTTIFEGVDACVTPVLSPLEASKHRYNTERNVFSDDEVIQPSPVPRFSRTPGSISRPPSSSGSGTREGLSRWGIDDERLALLRETGAFGSGNVPSHEVPRPSNS